MGFVLKYCASCGKRIPEEDMESGVAVEFNNRTYCRDHVPADSRRSIGALVAAGKRAGTAGVRGGTSSRAGGLESKRNTGIRHSPGRSTRIGTPSPDHGTNRPSGHNHRVEVKVSVNDSGTAQRQRPMPDMKKRSAAGPVMIIIALVVVGALGAVVAVAMNGSDAGPRNTTRASSTGNNNAGPTSGGSNTWSSRNGNAGATVNGGSNDPRRGWTDELSRINERFQRATAIDTPTEASEILKGVWQDIHELVRTAPALGVSSEFQAQAERLRKAASEILGELLWEQVRPLVLQARDDYRLGDAYRLMTEIAAGAQPTTVPAYVTDNPELFPAFFSQFNNWLAECRADFDAFQRLNRDTKGFIDHLSELRSLQRDALRADSGGNLNLDRMTAFLRRVEEVLSIYPLADPAAIPRVGRFSNDHGVIFSAYARYWVELVQNRPDMLHDREEAGEALDMLEWIRDSHGARWYLTDDARAGIESAIARIAGRLDVLRVVREELEALKQAPDFDRAFRTFFRIDLFCTIRPMTSEQRAEGKQLLRDAEAIVYAEIKKLKDATRDREKNALYVAAMAEYTHILAGKSEFADNVGKVGGWLEDAESEPKDYLMAFGQAVQRQCRETRQSQMYPHISWGFAASIRAAHGIGNWVIEDLDNRQFVPGTMQPSPATQLLNAILTRLVIDVDRDATLLLQTREDGASAWVVITRIDHILAHMLNREASPNEYRLLQQHRQQLETFAREPDLDD